MTVYKCQILFVPNETHWFLFCHYHDIATILIRHHMAHVYEQIGSIRAFHNSAPPIVEAIFPDVSQEKFDIQSPNNMNITEKHMLQCG